MKYNPAVKADVLAVNVWAVGFLTLSTCFPLAEMMLIELSPAAPLMFRVLLKGTGYTLTMLAS